MTNETIKTKLGAELIIRPADFADVMDLQSVLMNSVTKTGSNFDVADLEDVSNIMPLILNVAGNKDVHKAIFACLIRCTYNGSKINESLFDNFDVRADYYEIMIACVKFNCSIFFGELLSGLSSILPTMTENQK